MNGWIGCDGRPCPLAASSYYSSSGCCFSMRMLSSTRLLRVATNASRMSPFSTAGTSVCGEIEEEPEAPTLTRSIVTDLDALPITFSDISRAHVSIRSGIVRTPCVQSHFLSEIVGERISREQQKVKKLNFFLIMLGCCNIGNDLWHPHASDS